MKWHIVEGGYCEDDSEVAYQVSDIVLGIKVLTYKVREEQEYVLLSLYPFVKLYEHL